MSGTERARDPHDPKGLVREAYAIEGITAPECRSIFLDWALSLPEGTAVEAAARACLARHGREGHPMTAVLSEAAAPAPAPGRRGGRRARLGPAGGAPEGGGAPP
ncbi:hypothetical protein [Rubellimicrobium sp. CFH 75288]|uniref:hypothetical protein n=1 Tax=Rubellimicrobium sp. CFH 75288 TaxID=2697034 RepID=UPI001412F536|nr:hypothetical protein [Rubellimicrobium sp. CFH 75288]NAZ35417.1 hypothetical protein [Rubellimicrobium sp. CFH 75288]